MRTTLALIAAGLFVIAAQVRAQTIPDWSMPQLEQAIAGGELGRIAALVSEQRGEIVYRKRFDGEAEGQPVDVRSAGKSLTALAVGAAIADGKLAGVDVKVWPYLGASRGEPFDSITVRDLLTMSSPLDCFDGDPKSPGQEERMYRTRNWKDFALALPARMVERDFAGLYPHSYCTAGVFLLGQVVEKAVGERFDRYVQRRLFDPLDINSVEWRRSKSGEVQSGGQLRISDEDMVKLGRMVLDKGVWRGKRILPVSWVTGMLQPYRTVSPNVVYGYLWWGMPIRSPLGYRGAWMMQGNGGNYLALVAGYDSILLVQATNYNKPRADEWSFTALTALLAALPEPTAR